MRPPNCNRSHVGGFSLIELLTGLAVAGILTSIGLNYYSTHTEGMRIRLAQAEIASIQLAIASHTSHPGNPTGQLPENLAALNIDADLLTDPWGRAYRYARLGEHAPADDSVRIDSGQRPLNRDYDLFSLGRDGASQAAIDEPLAADDIVRGASGSFIGTAADYGAIAGAATAQLAAAHGGTTGSEAAAGGLDPRR